MLLSETNCTKSTTIAEDPDRWMKILIHARQCSEDPSTLDATRILDSTKSDLPEGTSLIADTIEGAFILLEAGRIFIFDYEDVRYAQVRVWTGIILHLGDELGVPAGLREITVQHDLRIGMHAPLRWLKAFLLQKMVRGDDVGDSHS